jgi:hypothetical protein
MALDVQLMAASRRTVEEIYRVIRRHVTDGQMEKIIDDLLRVEGNESFQGNDQTPRRARREDEAAMSEMGARDLRIWAQEEMADAVRDRARVLLEDHDSTFDERAAVTKQRDRVLRFLGQA